ncbi:hypothetical protein BXZ70DRAFT_542523 [Cristinia sonorae]|uniref:Uncharacterized protein n=1 Tax=Cristinia sonorae TaxID=1940300 RepID=A0A8K0UH50_9AGAR|nr:hypothetical protein BXZ70DRAFT_542523 [Cristinia sonorae]
MSPNTALPTGSLEAAVAPPADPHSSTSILSNPVFILGVTVPSIIFIALLLLFTFCYRQRGGCRPRTILSWSDVERGNGTSSWLPQDYYSEKGSTRTAVRKSTGSGGTGCTCVLCEARNFNKTSPSSKSSRSRSSSRSTLPTPTFQIAPLPFPFFSGSSPQSPRRHLGPAAATPAPSSPKTPSVVRSKSDRDRYRARPPPTLPPLNFSLARQSAAPGSGPAVLTELPPRARTRPRTRSEPAKVARQADNLLAARPDLL